MTFTVQSSLCTLHSALYTPFNSLYTLHPALCTAGRGVEFKVVNG
jgi:hypothetical protein